MVVVLCHGVWVAHFVAVAAGIVHMHCVWERGEHRGLIIQLGGSWGRGGRSFPRGCPLSGAHLTLEVELARPSGAARAHHREQGIPGFHQQKWLLHTLTVPERWLKCRQCGLHKGMWEALLLCPPSRAARRTLCVLTCVCRHRSLATLHVLPRKKSLQAFPSRAVVFVSSNAIRGLP